jgi:protein archease
MKFKFIDHTADLAVRVFGNTREELFRNAATALYQALGRFELNPSRITHRFELQENSSEELLVAFLSELLFQFDTHRFLFDKITFEELAPNHLSAQIEGAEIDLPKSEPNYEIKAVTYHQTEIIDVDGHWQAQVIFDV